MASKSDEIRHHPFELLNAYVGDRHHLPPKNAPLGAKFLLNCANTLGALSKEGKCDDWKSEMFEKLMATSFFEEHT